MTYKTSGSSTVYSALGITAQAESALQTLKAPLYIVAFTGQGRSGKSYTASALCKSLSQKAVAFPSAPGNTPVTHGIDLMCIPHPHKEGTILILDCEGGGNHNTTALPFVHLV